MGTSFLFRDFFDEVISLIASFPVGLLALSVTFPTLSLSVFWSGATPCFSSSVISLSSLGMWWRLRFLCRETPSRLSGSHNVVRWSFLSLRQLWENYRPCSALTSMVIASAGWSSGESVQMQIICFGKRKGCKIQSRCTLWVLVCDFHRTAPT